MRDCCNLALNFQADPGLVTRFVADVIRAHSREVNFGREDIRVTLSCGVAQYRNGEEFFTLIRTTNCYGANGGGQTIIDS